MKDYLSIRELPGIPTKRITAESLKTMLSMYSLLFGAYPVPTETHNKYRKSCFEYIHVAMTHLEFGHKEVAIQSVHSALFMATDTGVPNSALLTVYFDLFMEELYNDYVERTETRLLPDDGGAI